MKGIFESTIMGNLIGVISLIIGILSMILTIRTLKSATKIQKEMDKLKITTFSKAKFIIKKPKLEKDIDKYISTIRSAKTLSRKLYMNIYATIMEIEKVNDLFGESDYIVLHRIGLELKKIGTKTEAFSDADSQVFLDDLIQVKAIINKGDYLL